MAGIPQRSVWLNEQLSRSHHFGNPFCSATAFSQLTRPAVGCTPQRRPESLQPLAQLSMQRLTSDLPLPSARPASQHSALWVRSVMKAMAAWGWGVERQCLIVPQPYWPLRTRSPSLPLPPSVSFLPLPSSSLPASSKF